MRLGGAVSSTAALLLPKGSVMDEATKPDFPCRHFVAHPHCQHLLDSYFSGCYRCVQTAYQCKRHSTLESARSRQHS